jgi:hypothetical protein
MTRRGRRRWGVMSRLVIGKPGSPMLQRIRLIQTPWFGVYIHFIYREDRDRDVHDHPWPFATLVLRGGYDEEIVPFPHIDLDLHRRAERWNRWSFHRFPVERAHKITSVKPRTTTLVFVGKPTGREWRFWTPAGPVQWDHYLDRLSVLRGDGGDPSVAA